MRYLGLSVLALVAVAAVYFASVAVYYQVLPWFYGQQYAAERTSMPYVQTQQAGLTKHMGEWYDLDARRKQADPDAAASIEAQQRMVVRQMREIASTLKQDQIPADVQQFLATH